MSSLFRNAASKLLNGFRNNFNNNLINRNGGILQHVTRYDHSKPVEYEIVNPEENKLLSKEVISNINNEVARNEQGRLFAVVHLAGKQFKVTPGDVIVVEGYWPPDVGDKISLDKVMVAGGVDFSLIGTPLVQRDLVKVTGTIIEKTISHTKTHFRKKRRKQYKRIHFYRVQQTMVRINEVNINGEVNNPPDVTQGPVKTM